jgi:hypothetical protein
MQRILVYFQEDEEDVEDEGMRRMRRMRRDRRSTRTRRHVDTDQSREYIGTHLQHEFRGDKSAASANPTGPTMTSGIQESSTTQNCRKRTGKIV